MSEPNCESCLDAQNIKPGITNELRYRQAIDKLKGELDTVKIERDEAQKRVKELEEGLRLAKSILESCIDENGDMTEYVQPTLGDYFIICNAIKGGGSRCQGR